MYVDTDVDIDHIAENENNAEWKIRGEVKIEKPGSMDFWAMASLLNVLTLSSGVMSDSLCVSLAAGL